MAEGAGRTFGLPSVPRESMPSMFEILGWSIQSQQPTIQHRQQNKVPIIQPAKPKVEQKIVQSIPLSNSQYERKSPKKQHARSMTKSGLYQIKQACLKRSSSQQKCETIDTKITLTKAIQPPPKKMLDPTNAEDCEEIQKRIKRIKKFEYVTRDLSNSAFITYYGKPAWEVYGRCNSNPKMLTHNVMPHRGQNHPKKVQSYYSALIKGKNKSVSMHVPRKPVEQIPLAQKQDITQAVNLPLQAPDLINNVRFTAQPSRKSKNEKIPKATPISLKKDKNTSKKQKSQRVSPKSKLRNEQISDGLKYMNIRQNLLKILQTKKTNSSKLAWKVTQCYPFDLAHQQQLKESTLQWSKVQPAGVESTKCDKAKDLLQFINKTQP